MPNEFLGSLNRRPAISRTGQANYCFINRIRAIESTDTKQDRMHCINYLFHLQ